MGFNIFPYIPMLKELKKQKNYYLKQSESVWIAKRNIYSRHLIVSDNI